MLKMAEYLWIDGAKPTPKLRSKGRVIEIGDPKEVKITDFPEWGYDGSSTYQADGSSSDLVLKPVNFVKDTFRGDGNFLVMCEVYDPEGNPHSTNTRAELRKVLDAGAAKQDAWFGFEQEYTLFKGNVPLGWPENGYPAPQGPFYCGVGADEVFGRDMVEAHTQRCIDAGILIFGINAEVMPGQWEFQIGYRGIDSESADPLNTSDHVWFARWMLYRTGEEFGVTATLDPKPVRGDWNGAGQHTNFSTAGTRDQEKGMKAITDAIEKLSTKHSEHVAVYGHGLSERLTGDHETCSIEQFKSGVSDRGASIRIPLGVKEKGYGYIEDRRPGANADPYQIASRILRTISSL